MQLNIKCAHEVPHSVYGVPKIHSEPKPYVTGCVVVVVRWSDVVRRSDVARRSDEVRRSDVERRSDEGIFLCVPRPALLLIHPSGKSGEQVLSHISVEDRQRPASSNGNAKRKQAGSQGPRLECTLLDQAIGMECRLRQRGKALEEESS